MTVTADDLILGIRKYVASYLEEIGSSPDAQLLYLLNYISLSLRKLAHVAYQAKYSDTLNIIANGDQTFLQDGVAIDLYAPLRIIRLSDNQAVQKRTAYEAPTGWWRESTNMPINTSDMSGEHKLHYIKYPAKVTAITDPVEFPESGILGLMYYTSGMVLESLPNAKDLSAYFYGLAEKHLKVAVLANTDSRGQSSSGYVPSVAIIDQYFKG